MGSYEHGSKNGCLAAYIKMIQAAKDTITIANMSFCQPLIMKEIKAAVKRGVKIRIVTNISHKKSSLANVFTGSVNKGALASLVKLGISVYSYAKPYILYHKKVMVIDNQITVIGSFNISYHCADTEDEDIIVINSNKIADETLRILEEDIAASKKLKPFSRFASGVNSLIAKIILFFTKFIVH